MVNQEILAGLKHALERGSTLEKAMLSFWSAGYKNEEIEEAARVLVSQSGNEIPKETKQPVQTSRGFQTTLDSASAEAETEPVSYERKQLVSKYEQKTESRGKFIIILLIVIFFVFFAMLAGILIFKTELIQFFSNLFS